MKRAMRSFLVVIGCAMVAGAGAAWAEEEDEDGRAVLGVRVVYKGAGLAGAAVTLSPGGLTEGSNAQGYAVFKQLEPGRYTVTIDARCHKTTAKVDVGDLKSTAITVEIEDHCPSGDPDVTE